MRKKEWESIKLLPVYYSHRCFFRKMSKNVYCSRNILYYCIVRDLTFIHASRMVFPQQQVVSSNHIYEQ